MDLSYKKPNTIRTGEQTAVDNICLEYNRSLFAHLVFHLGDGYKTFVANNNVQKGKAPGFSYEALFLGR
jgi:hypothetical protein